MPRRLRIQYPGAIYHVMARGNGRQDIVRGDDDRDRLQRELGRVTVRCGWKVYAFVILSNHLHVVLGTPLPNLARGMQTFLSTYANAWARRHRFCGHIFQGRYRTELVEDETYLWTVTRYVHLNPVRAGLVDHPASWRWSSYPGYAHRGRRLEWVASDELLASWEGEFGGSDAAATYRRYVTMGLAEPPESPWRGAYQGWILGSDGFIDRVRSMAGGRSPAVRERRREARLLAGLPLERVCAIVCSVYGVPPEALVRRGSRQAARAALVYVARQRTTATHAELMRWVGVSRPESVPNLTRRFAAWLRSDVRAREQLRRIEEELDRLGTSEKTINSV